MSRAPRVVLLAVAILVLGAIGASGAGFYRTHDFYALYSGSRLVAAGVDPYDEVQWCAETEGVTPQAYDQSRHIAVCFVRYAYPMWTAIALLPFGMLPLTVASTLWLAVSIALSIAAIRWSWLAVQGGAGWAPLFVLIILFSQPFWLLLALGQMSGVLFAVTAFTAYALSRASDRPAGGVLALTALKPNVLPVFGAALLVWAVALGRRRVLVAAAAVGAALVALSLVRGLGWLGEWWHELFGRQIGHAVEYGTAWGLAAVDFHNVALAPVLIIALAAAVLIPARARLGDPVVLASIAVPLSLFATPYAWSYDFLPLALPWGYILAAASRVRARHRRVALLALLVVVAILGPWLLWAVAQGRHTESLSAMIPAATAMLVVVALRVSGGGPVPPFGRPIGTRPSARAARAGRAPTA